MTTAFLLPGFSEDKLFTDSSFDVLKHEMAAHDILLNGVTDGWKEHSIRRFGQFAVEQSYTHEYSEILIGHSLGALAALSVVEAMPIRHLVLCSPSALFSEDISANLNPKIAQRIGEERAHELMGFSANEAVTLINRLAIPTTVLFGENERNIHPDLVARSEQLAATIAGAKLVEIVGASHLISEKPYAHELARVVGTIASEL